MRGGSASVAATHDDGSPPVPFEALERIDALPRAEFIRRCLEPSRPVVVKNLTAGWLPPERWTFERMASVYGSARVVAAALENGTLFDDAKRGVVFERVRLDDVVRAMGEGSATHYVMAPAGNFPQSLQDDYRVPPYCVGASHLRIKVWLGKAGTVTPVHRDVPHNLHVHLTGRKRWLLFPPGHGARMYSRGLFSGMPNFAEVDPEHPDYARFPRFRGVRALGGVVEPGETLFIPHGWWHHTRTLDDAVSMNFWWGGALVTLAATVSAVFKRVRGIRQDEWADR